MQAMCILVGCEILTSSYRVLYHNCSPEISEDYLLLDHELYTQAICISLGCGSLSFSYKVFFHDCKPEITVEYVWVCYELLGECRWTVVHCHSDTQCSCVIVNSGIAERHSWFVLELPKNKRFVHLWHIILCNLVKGVLSWLQLAKVCHGTSRYWTSWKLYGIGVMILW